MFDHIILAMFLLNVGVVYIGRQVLTRRLLKMQYVIQSHVRSPLRKWFEYVGQIGAFIFDARILLQFPIPGTVWNSTFLKVCGALVMSVCVFFHLRAKSDLGANWTNAKDGATVRKGLITTRGLYAYSRNPMYTATLGMGFVCILMTQNVFVVAMWFLLFAYLLKVIKSEETLLEQEKGEPYRAYCQRVPRFI